MVFWRQGFDAVVPEALQAVTKTPEEEAALKSLFGEERLPIRATATHAEVLGTMKQLGMFVLAERIIDAQSAAFPDFLSRWGVKSVPVRFFRTITQRLKALDAGSSTLTVDPLVRAVNCTLYVIG